MGEVDDIIAEVSPYYKSRKQKKDLGMDIAIPSMEYKLMYDSSAETLEPVYFWILDMMDNQGFKTEKLIDTFASSPGSGHFSELQGKASQMQQESSRVLGTINNIIKGVLNLIYDLKEFKIRLSHYDAAKSKDKAVKEAGILSLKQIWMDKVDFAQRGQGSINALTSGNLQFITLRDAFMMVNSPEEVDKLDLNERVKRILKPRVQEFFEWKIRSEAELRKRYEIEKLYLKSQVEAVKLNTRWAKPYLRAAAQLMQNEKLIGNPGLVTAFNSVILSLSLFGTIEINVKDEVEAKQLPREFKKMRNLRKYYAVGVVDFNFRGIPSKQGQHYTFGGRSDVHFRAYTLNEDEIALLKDKLEESDLKTALGFVEGMTTGSLDQLKVDIDEILEEDEEKKKKDEITDPFSALFSFIKPAKPKDKKEQEKEKLNLLKQKGIKKENYAEKYLRALAEATAMNRVFSVYDLYKKGHSMAAFPYTEDFEKKNPASRAEQFFGFSAKHRG